jgi:hypothetical protein
MSCVYFIQQGSGGGSVLIKVGVTASCPYDCLKRLRRKQPNSSFELLGQIPIPYGELGSATKRGLQSRFESLRENGDFFRPGIELVTHIRQFARPHVCNRSCPDGTSIYEEWEADQRAASEAFQKSFSQKT